MTDKSLISYDAFTRRVMGRVYAVYFLRRISKPLFVEIFLFGVCTSIISLMVSLSHIITNAEHVPDASAITPLFRFFWSAFLNTSGVVKVLSTALALVIILFMYTVFYSVGKSFMRKSGRFLSQIFISYRSGARAVSN